MSDLADGDAAELMAVSTLTITHHLSTDDAEGDVVSVQHDGGVIEALGLLRMAEHVLLNPEFYGEGEADDDDDEEWVAGT